MARPDTVNAWWEPLLLPGVSFLYHAPDSTRQSTVKMANPLWSITMSVPFVFGIMGVTTSLYDAGTFPVFSCMLQIWALTCHAEMLSSFSSSTLQPSLPGTVFPIR